MTAVTRAQRLYFAAVGAFAAWVGVWGYFQPALVDHALPWLVPPLHARFLGAVYFSATVLLAGGLLARRWAEVRGMVPVIAVWTGMLLVVSFFHWGEFDFGHRPVWFWFFAYVLYPLIAFVLMARHRGQDEHLEGQALPGWAAAYFKVQGAALTILAVSLLVAPSSLAALWPWKVSPLLTQIYSAPFLAYGLASWRSARERTWPEVRLVVCGLFAFAGLSLIASGLHRGLFTASRPATWVWFGGLGLVAAVHGFLIARSLTSRSLP